MSFRPGAHLATVMGGQAARERRLDGYRAYKIHPYFAWDPATRMPTLPKPAPVDWDIEICRAVRDAVGDDMVLMFDPWGAYNYADALRVGRELERLGFYWYEHPMPEHRSALYVQLAEELTIPICSPEIAEGGIFTRATGFFVTHPTSVALTCCAAGSPAR